jgi:hypothetical protein
MVATSQLSQFYFQVTHWCYLVIKWHTDCTALISLVTFGKFTNLLSVGAFLKASVMRCGLLICLLIFGAAKGGHDC